MENPLLDITGVGPATARLLTEAGISSVASVANADPATLAAIRGIGPISAESIKTEALRLFATSEPGPADVVAGPSLREQQAKELRKRAKKLRKQAGRQTKKAKKATSKKKRKRLANEAARLEKAAGKARRKAKKLLAG